MNVIKAHYAISYGATVVLGGIKIMYYQYLDRIPMIFPRKCCLESVWTKYTWNRCYLVKNIK